MTTTIPVARQDVYRFSDDLSEDAIPFTESAPNPGEIDRENLVLRKLGVRCWGRLYHFRNFYQHGWGDGHGRTLSPRALEIFYRFIEEAVFPQGINPSLFLTDDGHLELCWDSQCGGAVQVEFTPSGAEYFIERLDSEDTVPFTEISLLAKRVLA